MTILISDVKPMPYRPNRVEQLGTRRRKRVRHRIAAAALTLAAVLTPAAFDVTSNVERQVVTEAADKPIVTKTAAPQPAKAEKVTRTTTSGNGNKITVVKNGKGKIQNISVEMGAASNPSFMAYDANVAAGNTDATPEEIAEDNAFMHGDLINKASSLQWAKMSYGVEKGEPKLVKTDYR